MDPLFNYPRPLILSSQQGLLPISGHPQACVSPTDDAGATQSSFPHKHLSSPSIWQVSGDHDP